MEPSVIRLSHCQKEIFCFSVPEQCPSCGEELRGSRLQEAPVSLPSPLPMGTRAPAASLLHLHMTTTPGVVYNYTQNGVQREQRGWERCISIPLVRPDMFHLLAQWDQYLERFSEGPMWDPVWQRFHEDDHNCFSFCLQFLNTVLTAEGCSSLSKEDFTRCFILPRMKRVSKYTTLVQHIEKQQFYMVDRPQEAEPSS